MQKVTEAPSNHRHLEQMTTRQLLHSINAEDASVAAAVAKSIPAIEALADAVADRMLAGGRLFYIGAGTSGRLGIVDASECPPTFGVPQGLVVGIIAGGDGAIRMAVEHAEDDRQQAWTDLKQHAISEKDVVVGIAASGTTPYVVGGLSQARKHRITTGCITCNPGSPVAAESDFPVEVIVGPEFVTGSTRMKAGTAQKMVLNMISTTVMIRLGRVEDNRMVNMQLTNDKLIERGIRMVHELTGRPLEECRELLLAIGSVKLAVKAAQTGL